jgi:flagellar hook protein FlgE
MNSLSATALSGMNAAMLRLGSAAHNVANGLTPDFRRQVVQQAALPEGGVVVSIGRAPEPGHELARDIVEQMAASYSFKANLGVIRTQDEMLGSLLDLRA